MLSGAGALGREFGLDEVMSVHLYDEISVLIRKGRDSVCLSAMRERGLSARKRTLTRSESSGTLVSDLPASRSMNSKYLLLALPASGVLLWQPELRQKVKKKTERPTISTMVVIRLWFVQLELQTGCQLQFNFLWKRPLEI